MPRGDYDEPGRPTDLPTRNLPEEWVGIYKTVDDVPGKYRLRKFESELDAADEDPFDAYLAARDDLSDWSRNHKHGKAYRDFSKFMRDRGKHPACPTPDDVCDFFERVRNGEWSNVKERELRTVHATYGAPLKVAFAWFVSRVDYPHVYNPIIMAALRDGPLRDAWVNKIIDDEDRWERRKNGEPARPKTNE